MGMKVMFRTEVTGQDKWDLIQRGLLEAVNKGLARAGAGVQSDMRAAVRRAKFQSGGIKGQDFEKSFRVDIWPKSRNVYARTPAMTVGTSARYAEVFEEGADVVGRSYLAVPLPPARQLGFHVQGVHDRKKSDVKAAQAKFGPLRRIPTKKGYILAADARKVPGAAGGLGGRGTPSNAPPSMRVARAAAGGRKRRFVPLFAMVQQVRLAKRYSIRAIVERNTARIGDAVQAEMRRIFGE